MFEIAIQRLTSIINRNAWITELAGILPLSALIDFLDIPPKLHIFELAGAAPLWSWPVTPAGSRLLLSEDRNLIRGCYLDLYGNSVSLKGADGRYGDQYLVASPETLRLCLEGHPAREIDNAHVNMREDGKRMQNLQVVYVSRMPKAQDRAVSSSWLRHMFLDPLRVQSPRYLVTSFLGWATWVAMVIMCGILQTWIALAFLALVPTTGFMVFIIYGSSPRTLLNESASKYNRLVLVSEHENSTDWIAFYGESSIVNSILNRQLDVRGPKKLHGHQPLFLFFLRILILGQWAMVLAAAATKNWNSYFICFWVALCIFTHAYILTPPRAARYWLNYTAKVQFERFNTQLSSRRTLLNTIIAMNPDAFAPGDRTRFSECGMKWIDPILKAGQDRSRWEKATLEAMNESANGDFSTETFRRTGKRLLSVEWTELYKADYWRRFIEEGISMAQKIRKEVELPGRMVMTKNEIE